MAFSGHNTINSRYGDVVFVDEDGNPIEAGNERILYVDVNGFEIPQEVALSLLSSGQYIDTRQLFRISPEVQVSYSHASLTKANSGNVVSQLSPSASQSSAKLLNQSSARSSIREKSQKINSVLAREFKNRSGSQHQDLSQSQHFQSSVVELQNMIKEASQPQVKVRSGQKLANGASQLQQLFIPQEQKKPEEVINQLLVDIQKEQEQRQVELQIEKQRQEALERQIEAQRQVELEQQRLFEIEQQALIEQQRQLEVEQQRLNQQQRQLEIELEAQRQLELEAAAAAEAERQRQHELQLEREQAELVRLQRQAEEERERQKIQEEQEEQEKVRKLLEENLNRQRIEKEREEKSLSASKHYSLMGYQAQPVKFLGYNRQKPKTADNPHGLDYDFLNKLMAEHCLSATIDSSEIYSDPSQIHDEVIDIDYGAIDAFTKLLNEQLEAAAQAGQSSSGELKFKSNLIKSNYSSFVDEQILMGAYKLEDFEELNDDFYTSQVEYISFDLFNQSYQQ